MSHPYRRPQLATLLTVAAELAVAVPAHAQITRLDVTSRTPVEDGRAFGKAGPYELIRGRAHGEVDPGDPRNRIIQDLELAPRNARGRVEYVATFALMRPVDPGRASGVLMYSVVNRGNGAPQAGPDGHISLVSGWQGDVPPTAVNQTIEVPVAVNADGTPVTGPVLARFVDLPAGTSTAEIRIGSMGTAVYAPASLDPAAASLTAHTAETMDGGKEGLITIPASDWAFADCRTSPFPGTPDPARLCVRGGFDPGRVYELTYTAKDPLVLGLGLAAVRDLVAFFRHATADSAGNPNPVASQVRHTIATGTSQSGNLLKTFVHLGFNEDLAGRPVFEGILPFIAARQTPINFRFAAPGGAGTLYEPGSEPVLWWSRYTDTVRGRPAASLLDRCAATQTCPKVIEVFGATEFWDLRMSPGLVGTDARADIPLPPNVRRYYLPGTTHGGGRGGFALESRAIGRCVLPENPNPMSDTLRALTQALVAWVVDGTEPPPSRYPTLTAGQLVTPAREAMGFPRIPGVTMVEANPVLDYAFGPRFRANDMSGIIDRQPPAITQALPTLVPRVDGDGNEVGGVPSPLLQAPLGTYLGWNIQAAGFFKGQICSFLGGYVPFAKTRAEREAAGDPRPSLEERYGTREGYACVVRRAADALVRERFLLVEDGERIAGQAAAVPFLPAAADAGPAARQRGAELCR